MTAIGGYQSDLKLSDQTFDGNLPAENDVGGFGIAKLNAGNGTGDGGDNGEGNGVDGENGLEESDNYTVSLDPPLTDAYPTGLSVLIQFEDANTQPATINIDGQGAENLVHLRDGKIEPIEEGAIVVNSTYLLVFNGGAFQMITLPGMDDFPIASEAEAGIAEIATQSEATAGVDDTKIITPLKLQALFGAFIVDKGNLTPDLTSQFPEGKRGDFYTVDSNGIFGGEEEDDGILLEIGDIVICSGDNEGGSLNQVGNDWIIIKTTIKEATEEQAGILSLASLNDMLNLTDNQKIVTPLRLKDALDQLNLSKIVFRDLATSDTGAAPGTADITLGMTYTLPAGELTGNQGIHVNAGGTIDGAGSKNIKVLVGTEIIFSKTVATALQGNFALEVLFWRVTTSEVKGFVKFHFNSETEVVNVLTSTLSIDTTDHPIRTTGQSASGLPQIVVRETYIVTKLISDGLD